MLELESLSDFKIEFRWKNDSLQCNAMQCNDDINVYDMQVLFYSVVIYYCILFCWWSLSALKRKMLASTLFCLLLSVRGEEEIPNENPKSTTKIGRFSG